MTIYNSRAEKKSQTKPFKDFLIDWNQPQMEEVAPADGQGP